MSETVPPQRTRSLFALAGFLALCLAVAALGGMITRPSLDGWYAALEKPAFTPPDWVFPVVWNAIFVLMAVAGWRVWRSPRSRVRQRALRLFWVQLGLNLLWSALFFGLHGIGLALIEVVVLLAVLVWTADVFRRCDRWAGWLFLPYVLWVAFATALNTGVWWLNPLPPAL